MGATLIRTKKGVTMKKCAECSGKGTVKVGLEITTPKSKPAKKGTVSSKMRREAERAAKRMAKQSVGSKRRAVIEDDEDEDDDSDDDDDDVDFAPTTVRLSKDEVAKLGKLTPEQKLAKETIEERAAFFGCPGKVKAVRKGPVITLYEFAPSKTTRIKRLINLQEDLALALSAEAVMVRRIPGKEVMGIEISNESAERQNVAFRASLKNVAAAKKRGMELPINLGTDPFGEPIVDDLAGMPHLLIAGSTGAGKSVSLNAIIGSLLTVCSPEELQFYMIDPKGVELVHYAGIPHMQMEMVTSPHYAKDMLERLNRTMRTRLQTLTYAKVRDIKEYNELVAKDPTKGHRMPRIVLVVDELGDLMMQDRREFTRLFAEIAQIARATGIHMICATQRPSVDVLSGKIKVNFPARMAFKVTSGQDSRTVLHKKGAEGLLGRGDMMYLSPTRSALIRIHAPWVPLEDVKAIADQLRAAEAKRLEDERLKQLAIQEEARKLAAKAAARTGVTPETAPTTLKQGESEKLPITFGWDVTKK
jgi:S-DNA-T family DNA segregation ATPase FtsK/SpoIIIE